MKTASYGYPSNQLEDIFLECASENWDGYGASPIHNDTYTNALRFLHNLPYNLPSPDVSPEPDGDISFEWYCNPSHVVSISVGPKGYLYFAALIGLKKRYGSEPFGGEIPQEIFDVIHQVIEP